MKQNGERSTVDIQEITASVAELGSKLEHLRGYL